MCEPMSAGLAAEGFGSLLKANAQLKHGAEVKDRMNLSGDFAEAAAADAVKRGELRDLQVVMRGSAVIAEQRAAMSATGADINTGGDLQTQLATRAVSDLDRRVVARNAALDAYGLRAKAQTDRQQGEDAEAAARSEALGTFLGGAGGLIGQGGKLFSDLKSRPGDTSYGGGDSADEAD